MRIQPIFWPGPPRWHSVTQRDVLQRPGGHKGGCFDVRRYLSTHVRLPSPASQSCSNDARGSSCAEQRRYTTRSRSRCWPQRTWQTVKAYAAHPAGVSTNASPTRALAFQACSRTGFMASIQLKCIGRSYRCHVHQARWFKFPVPCLGQENKLLIIFIDVALAHVIEKGTLQWKPGFDMQCIDARYDTVPASMVVRAAPHWRPPSTCAPPNITDAHTTTTGIKASRLLTPLYQTKARTARRHSSTNTARRMAWSPFILTWAKPSVYHPEHRIF